MLQSILNQCNMSLCLNLHHWNHLHLLHYSVENRPYGREDDWPKMKLDETRARRSCNDCHLIPTHPGSHFPPQTHLRTQAAHTVLSHFPHKIGVFPQLTSKTNRKAFLTPTKTPTFPHSWKNEMHMLTLLAKPAKSVLLTTWSTVTLGLIVVPRTCN